MSIRPVNFNADGSIEIFFDELGHSGTIAAAEVKWGADHNSIVLECPDGCGSVSTHPVGGGAAPLLVQEMFVRKVERDGCACQVRARSREEAIDHVRALVEQTDGPGRWQFDAGT